MLVSGIQSVLFQTRVVHLTSEEFSGQSCSSGYSRASLCTTHCTGAKHPWTFDILALPSLITVVVLIEYSGRILRVTENGRNTLGPGVQSLD